MRKVFIDCGYYQGWAINKFKRLPIYDNSFEIFAFEASPITRTMDGVNYINKAVWIKDGTLDFFSSTRRGGQANGIFKNINARKEKSVSIDCLDFSKWILDNFSKEDKIYLKMDIEGAEYEVLHKMIDDGSIVYINTAYIEWHYERRSEIDVEKFLELKRKIDATGVSRFGQIK